MGVKVIFPSPHLKRTLRPREVKEFIRDTEQAGAELGMEPWFTSSGISKRPLTAGCFAANTSFFSQPHPHGVNLTCLISHCTPCLHSHSLLETPLRWGGTEKPPKSPAHTSLSLQPSMVRDPSPEWTALAPGEGGWEARPPPQVSWSDLIPSPSSFWKN